MPLLPNEKISFPNQRLGLTPKRDVPLLRLSDYLTSAVPAHPPSVDHISRVPTWCMGGNNKYGTCEPTCIANYMVMAYKYLLGENITVADTDVFNLYRESGNPRFNPVTDVDDNGVDFVVGLEAVCTYGLRITHAPGHVGPMTEMVKPLAFAAVNSIDREELQAATAIFGGVLLGATMDVAQQTETIWSYVPKSPVWGGHAFMGGSYTGVVSDDIEVISWQQMYGTTDMFITEQVDQGFILILPIMLRNKTFMNAVNLGALGTDYTTMTDRPFPKVALWLRGGQDTLVSTAQCYSLQMCH